MLELMNLQKRMKDYRNFVYIYEGEPSTLPKPEKEVSKHQKLGAAKVQPKSSVKHHVVGTNS